MIYLFDKDENLFKVVQKQAIKMALQKYTLTTERYVSDRLTVEMKTLNDDELEKVEYMAIQTMEDAHKFHYFYVAQKSSEQLTALIGVQSGIEELRKSPVFDKRPKNAFAREVIDDLLASTNWQARFVGETTPHSTNFYYISTFDALKKVCDVWDLEMQFFVEMNGNQIGARYIDFKRKIGQAVGKRVVYGHNALQILHEVERTNIFTALVGRGKGVQVSSAGDTGASASGTTDSQGPQQADGYGRKITFEDVIWSTAKGNPVNKPKGQKYLELPEMTKLYGIKNADGTMRPKTGFVEFSEEEDPEILIERTYKALVDSSRPQLTLKTSSVYLKGAKVGDTIRVVRHDRKLDYETRIFEITFNRLNNQSSDIKLGDRIGESNEAKAQTIADKAIDNFVVNEFSNFVQNLPDYLPSADGFNNNWYGAEDPSKKHLGKVLINDIWYKPDSEHEGHKIMLRWTGEVWEEILRTYDSEALRDRIAEEVGNVNKMMLANESERDRQIAGIVGKFNDNKLLINEAKQLADRANQSIASQAREMQQLLNQSQRTLSGQIAAVSQTLSETKRNLLEQANAQRELSSRVTTVEETANSTRTTVTELQKTVNVTTGNLDAVSRRTKTVEDNLSGLTTRFENIRVGGRNLLTGTRDFSGEGWYQQNTWITDGDYKGAKVITWQSGNKATPIALYQVESGQTYTFSAWVKREQQGTVYFYLYDNDSLNMTSSTRRDHALNNVSNEFQRFSLTFTATRSGLMKARFAMVNSENGSFSVAGFQLVTGEIDSDWSVNSNEFYSELATYQQTVDRNFAELTRTTQTVSDRATEYKSAFDQTAERFRTSINALEVYKNNEGVRAQAYFNASRDETARQIREERTAISENYIAKSRYEADARGIRERFEGLSVGGRNYIRDFGSFGRSLTPFTQGGWRYELLDDSTARSGKAIKLTAIRNIGGPWFNGFDFLKNPEFQNRQMTWSVDIKSNKNFTANSIGFETGGTTSKSITTEYQRFSHTFINNFTRWWSFVIYGHTFSEGDVLYIRDPQLEDGSIATTPHASDKDTETRLTEFSRGIDGQISTVSKAIKDNNDVFLQFKSKIIQTAEGLVSEVSGPGGLKSQMSQLAGSWAVRNLTNSGTILNQLNLNRDGSVKIDGKLVQITGTTYIQDGVITSAKIANLDAGKVTTGTLDAADVNIINLNANNIVGLDAKFIKAKIEYALVEWLKGKVVAAQNDAMRINLNQANITFNQNATIDFNSSNNALVRRKGTHTAFVHFNDVASSSDGGVGSLYASIGVTSSGDGINSASSGRFCGSRFFRGARGGAHGATIDQAEIYGDDVLIKDDFSLSRGFRFRPTTIDKMIDMNYLIGAVRALSRCWLHWNNIGWDPNNNDMRNAVIREYNNYMKDL